jgi:hypothetical protein
VIAALVIVGLASARLWRLAALDEITAPIRDRLPVGVQTWLGCPWCAGVWITAAVAIAWEAGVPNAVMVAVAAMLVVGVIGERI